MPPAPWSRFWRLSESQRRRLWAGVERQFAKQKEESATACKGSVSVCGGRWALQSMGQEASQVSLQWKAWRKTACELGSEERDRQGCCKTMTYLDRGHVWNKEQRSGRSKSQGMGLVNTWTLRVGCRCDSQRVVQGVCLSLEPAHFHIRPWWKSSQVRVTPRKHPSLGRKATVEHCWGECKLVCN
jgi:hypothetical protein